MRADNIHLETPSADGRQNLSAGSLVYRWAGLMLCLTFIWAFMFIVAPLGAKIPMVNQIHKTIAQSGINASALYYTEIEESSEAEMYLRNSAKY